MSKTFILAATLGLERDSAPGVTDAPHLPAAARNVCGPGRASTRQRPLCEVRMGSLNVGTMEGKALEVVDMMKRRKTEVLCVQETKWRGARARNMAEGYKMLHTGEDGRSNGVGIIVNVEISKEVVRVERWQGRSITVRMMIRQHSMCHLRGRLPEEGEPQNHLQERTAQDRA